MVIPERTTKFQNECKNAKISHIQRIFNNYSLHGREKKKRDDGPLINKGLLKKTKGSITESQQEGQQGMTREWNEGDSCDDFVGPFCYGICL